MQLTTQFRPVLTNRNRLYFTQEVIRWQAIYRETFSYINKHNPNYTDANNYKKWLCQHYNMAKRQAYDIWTEAKTCYDRGLKLYKVQLNLKKQKLQSLENKLYQDLAIKSSILEPHKLEKQALSFYKRINATKTV